MNLIVLIEEGIILTLAFNLIVFVSLYKNPVWWVHDYPKDIQNEYFKTHKKIPVKLSSKNVIVKKGAALIIAIVVFIFLMNMANAKTFMEGFLGSYLIWSMINIWDCLFMDWVLFANMKGVRLPGTEHMDKEYHQKKYHFVRGCIGMALGIIPCLITGFSICLINM